MRCEDARVLFLAEFAPVPDSVRAPSPNETAKYAYHRELFSSMKRSFPHAVPGNSPQDLIDRHDSIDFLFTLLHGDHYLGRECLVPALAEKLRVPYIGARPAMREVAEDKHLSKVLAAHAGLRTPEWTTFDASGTFYNDFGRLHSLEYPVFVKPRYGANSDFVSESSICHDEAAAFAKVHELLDAGVDVIAERYIEGTFLTQPVWALSTGTTCLPGIVQEAGDSPIMLPRHKIIDACLPERRPVQDADVQARLEEESLAFCGLIEPFDYVRIDYILEGGTGRLYFIEANICCGISSKSTFFRAAQLRFGYDYDAFVRAIVCNAMRRYGIPIE